MFAALNFEQGRKLLWKTRLQSAPLRQRGYVMLTMCFLYGRYTKNSLYFLAVRFYTGCGIYAVFPFIVVIEEDFCNE